MCIRDSGYVENLVKTIMVCGKRLQKDPKDAPARATFMWAATLAWNGLGVAGIGACGVPMHLLEHPLSGIYDVAHGAGLSITIPAWLSWKADKDPGKIAQFTRNVMGIDEKDQDEAARRGIQALKAWFEKLGSPVNFAQAKIPESDIDSITDKTLALAEAWGMDAYKNRKLIVDLYELCV